MKLNYYQGNELVKKCADKYRVREYIKECGLDFLLNELITTYHNANEIQWDALPEKFVLKWNFGCGGNVVCQDKNTLDKNLAIQELNTFKKIKFHLLAAEPQYDVDEKIILCEKFIESEDGHLPSDYKFYCFNGKAKYVLCCLGRGEHARPDFYFFDRNWELQRLNAQGVAAPKNFTVPKPKGMDELFDYAEKLSAPFPFVRVDFYLEKGKPYFGEMTFTPAGGFDPGRLPESDLLFGKMVKLQQMIIL
ncbi:MAG: glycosyl transferase [Bacteroidales bacterium]|nr:glycosyl transferase [Bacteroidales bacterium]